MRTIALLLFSNVFMTFAWYGHLRNQQIPLWKAILVSWGIAFFEYCRWSRPTDGASAAVSMDFS